MNSVQEAAFEAANAGNSSFSPLDLSTLIVSIIGTVIIVWFCWTSVSAFKAFGKGRLGISDAGSVMLRALFVMVVVLAVISF